MDTIKTFKKEAKNLFVPIEKDDIKKLHNIILEILKDIIDFCNQNDLIYYFTGGSAIGVVREQGFIPWDDDIDLVMPRKDYNILREKFESVYPTKYIVEAPHANQVSSIQFMKIRKKGTILRGLMAMGPEYGVFIDIFPLDYAPNSFFHRQLCNIGYFILKSMHYSIAFYMLYDGVFKPHEKECSRNLLLHMKMKYLWGKLLSKIQTLKKWQENFDDRIQKKPSRYYVNAAGIFSYNKECFPIDYYYPPRKAKFEGMDVLIPNKVESILTRFYGDFMTPPQKPCYIIMGFTDVRLKKTEANKI